MKPMRLAPLAMSFLCLAATASADSFLVTLDTSSLSGTQTLVFGLTNSDGDSNTVSLSAFNFDGGSAVSGSDDCTLAGTFSGLGCNGNLASGVTLEDLDPVAAFFTQQFDPGASLSFMLTTTNSFAGGTPDQFAMFLCDDTLSTCYSDDATGALLLVDLNGGSLSPSSFLLFGASLQELDLPVVTEVPDSSQVPEPGTLLLLGSALTAVVARGRRN
jgi:hypothetical protein